MKVAIFSDIHGNREALISIIKDIKKEGIKKIICLGDTIGIGPNPKECMDIIVDNNIKMVLGNHELYFIKGTQIDDEMGDGEIKHQNWIKNQITDRQKQYLEKCNMTYEIDCNGKKVVFEHFLIDYNSNDQYPFHDLKIAKDGSINEKQTKEMIDIIKEYQGEVVFHRAFDCVADPYAAIELLIHLGVDRILTSGLKPKAMDGKELIKDLQNKYGNQIEILAGSGINASNARKMMEDTGIYQVHSSCKDWINDPTTKTHEVSYAYAPSPHENDYDVVSKELVEKIVESIK